MEEGRREGGREGVEEWRREEEVGIGEEEEQEEGGKDVWRKDGNLGMSLEEEGRWLKETRERECKKDGKGCREGRLNSPICSVHILVCSSIPC